MKNKKNLISLVTAITLVSTLQAVSAESAYQFEAAGGYLDSNTDSGADSNIYLGGVRAYLNPINNDNYPYAESEFIARQPYVTAIVSRISTDFLTSDISGNLYVLGAGYSNKDQPVFVEAIYITGDQSGDINNENLELSLKAKGISLGYFFNETTTAKISYTRREIEINSISFSDDANTNKYELAFKKIMGMSDSSFVNVEGALGYYKDNDSDANQEIEILVDYYPDKTLILGGGIGLNKGDNESDEGKTFSLQASKFITTNIAVALVFSKFMADISENDSQEIELDVILRF